MKETTLWILAGLCCGVLMTQAAEDRREKVLRDRTEVQSIRQWIYNDLSRGFAEARQTGKPMLVVLRCIP